jgi:CcmD family protein
MTTLAIAYSLAWLAVTLYVVWLGSQHRRLAKRIDALTKTPGTLQSANEPRRAA